MNINPLLKQAVVLSQDSGSSIVLKHTSKTTDMSHALMALVDQMVTKYRKPRLTVYVKRFDDGRIYVHFTGDINHPDDTIPFTKAKQDFIKEVKQSSLLASTN